MASQSKLAVAAIQSVNDFVVKFANVNGSGSASANSLFAKSILRMGIPASSRNIFPSNIQGLPTWYEVRISESGHLGRRGGVDLMVAMNPETWDEDLAEIEANGYLFYDSTKPLPPSKFPHDINVIGAPLTAICNREYTDARQRQLFKNIIYLGVLSALLDIDVAAIAVAVRGKGLGQRGGRGDRIPGGDGRPAIDAAQRGGVVAGDEDAIADLVDALQTQPDRALVLGERPVAAQTKRMQIGFDQRVPAAELLADQLLDRRDVDV